MLYLRPIPMQPRHPGSSLRPPPVRKLPTTAIQVPVSASTLAASPTTSTAAEPTDWHHSAERTSLLSAAEKRLQNVRD